MKRIFRLLAKLIWRMSAPVRRPLLARFDAHVAELIGGTVNARIMPELIKPLAISLHRLERIEDSLARADHAASAMAEEVDMVLNGLSREIFRLQSQVEMLQRLVNDNGREPARHLSIIDEAGDEAPVHRPGTTDRSMVG